MKIARFNKDAGNSGDMSIIDGYYFDFPTNVVELKKEEAESFFTDTVDTPEEYKQRMLISTTLRGEDKERFFLVGEIAAEHILANLHVNELHNKITSHIPYVTFLAALSYYNVLKGKEGKVDSKIEVEYFSTMLPIWLLKKYETFKEAQTEMATRFYGEHELKVHTPGLERTLKIDVKESDCFKEGDIARFALKKELNLEDREDVEDYTKNDVIYNDLGGGSDDIVIFPTGLKAPNSRDSFISIEEMPYLAHIEKLRKDKFPDIFRDLRSFDKFIVKNYEKRKFELVNPNTGEKKDLTKQIKASLKSYAERYIAKMQASLSLHQDKEYTYVYAGGVAPILKDAIVEIMTEKIGEELTEKNHKFPKDSRHLNLFGLEIRSIGYLMKKEAVSAK